MAEQPVSARTTAATATAFSFMAARTLPLARRDVEVRVRCRVLHRSDPVGALRVARLRGVDVAPARAVGFVLGGVDGAGVRGLVVVGLAGDVLLAGVGLLRRIARDEDGRDGGGDDETMGHADTDPAGGGGGKRGCAGRGVRCTRSSAV